MLELLHEFEVMMNILYQGIGEAWLVGPMQLISFLGTENIFMVLMPMLYWCVGVRFGLRMGVMLLFSNGVNSVLKLAFHSPRPYWIDERVLAWGNESSFGLPSGHAQVAASVWGLMGYTSKKAWGMAAALILILLIGLSRIYLGLHFLSDVIVGWVVGGLLVMIFIRMENRIAGWISQQNLRTLLWGCVISSVVFIGLIVGIRMALNGWQPPAEWQQLALTSSGEGIDPLNVESAFTIGGTWLGMLGGAAWLFRSKGGLDVSGTILQKVFRFLIGLIGIMLFWYGLGQIFPQEENLISYILRFVRYTLVGLWVSAFAPLLFRRLGLVK